MNILLINHYAGSPDMGMEFRPYYMAREWVKLGHKVTIVAGDYSHLRRKNPSVQKDFEREDIDGIRYYWVKTGRYEGNGVKRALSMARFTGKLWLRAKWIAKKFRPDAIITSSTYPIDTYAGQRIRHFAPRAKLVHEVHDMWPISPMELNGMSKYHPFIVLMQLGENSFCRKSDAVVSLLPNAKNYLVKHGMAEEKFVHVPNGIVLDEWTNYAKLPAEHKELLRKWRQEDRFIICFFGSHTKSYALSYLIDAVKEMKEENLRVLFVGNGTDKDALMTRAKEAGDQIKFLPPIPKNSIPDLLENVDAVYVGALNNRMFRFGICMNKLFDSMMAGKPILYAVNAPNDYIRQFHCGVSVKPESVAALQTGIRELSAMTPKEREQLGQNGRKAVLEHFEYSVLAKKFLEALK